jgi:hypothetical protein
VDDTICPGTPNSEGRNLIYRSTNILIDLSLRCQSKNAVVSHSPTVKGESMPTSTQYDHATLSAVWNKGQAVLGNDANVFRKDIYGAWMRWDQYGKTLQYGWEVDHIIPLARRGSEALNNLQPLQWENNRRKGDNRW